MAADLTGQQAPDTPASGTDAPCDASVPLLEVSDLLDAELRLRLAAYRDGYRCGCEAGYAAGFADGVLYRKREQHALVDGLELYARRWELRGERRGRSTFSRPHPDDFPGRGAAG